MLIPIGFFGAGAPVPTYLYHTATDDSYTGMNFTGVGVDKNLNYYVAGLASYGGGLYYRSFVSKYDSKGNLQWAKRIGNNTSTSTYNQNYTVKIDPSGNPIIAANYDIGGSQIRNTATKLDANGNLVWSIGANYGNDVQNIAVDSAGNTIMTGFNANGVRKYSPTGTILWERNLNVSGYTDVRVTGVTTDSSDNVILTTSTNAYVSGGVLFKLDSNGNKVKVSWLGSNNNQLTNPIAIGTDIYAVGMGANTAPRVFKFDTNFNTVWAKVMPNYFGSWKYSSAIAASGDGHIYYSLNAGTNEVAYVFKLDTAGTIIWARSMTWGGSYNTSSDNLSIAALPNGDFAIGSYNWANPSYGGLAVLPKDGSKTGTWNVAGKTITYASYALSLTDITYNLTDQTSSSSVSTITGATSYSPSIGTLATVEANVNL